MTDQSSNSGMSRRSFIAAGAAGMSVAALVSQTAQLSGGAVHAATASKRPNILFMMADQFRGDCLASDGNPAVKTPHIDRIGHEGIRFRRAYTCTPSCTPARAALLSGLGPWRNGMLGYGRVAEKYPMELPQAMRDAGYYTFGIGKMHWAPQRSLHGFHGTLLDESSREESVDFRSDYKAWFLSQAPHAQIDQTGIGWNDYRSNPYVLPEHLHPTHWTGECAVRFLEGYEREEPFFLKVSFARPHSPYDAPERFWKMYENAPIPKAVVGKWAAKYAKRSDDGNSIWHGDMGEEQVRKSRIGYYGNVTFIDEQIGRILEALEKRGWLDNTLIIFTADHGDMTGDHHMWRKTYAYEASARIPMLMRWPTGLLDAERGQVCSKPTELRDILPTCLDTVGATGAEDLDGASLLDLARGKTAEWREYLDLEHDVCYGKDNHWNALTDGRWKYIFHAMDGAEQLFDLDTDPGELNDLASAPAHRAELEKWRARLVDHLSERGEAFVKDGKLVARPERTLYSPNYPGNSFEPRRKKG